MRGGGCDDHILSDGRLHLSPFPPAPKEQVRSIGMQVCCRGSSGSGCSGRPHQTASSKERAGGIVDKKLAVTDVAAEHGVARVAGLRPDLERRDARLHGAGDETGAQTVAGEPVGSIFAAATRSLTTSNTASPDSRSSPTRPCRSTGRKTGPASIPQTLSQCSRARTGQWRVRPNGMPTLRPAPSWSTFERLSVTMAPCRTRSTSSQFKPTISDRRNPPAKPIRSSARSRASFTLSPMKSRTRNRSSRSSGLASRWAIPRVRLTPRNVARTISDRQAFGSPWPRAPSRWWRCGGRV
jgi:hypothetical protein